MFYLVRNEDEDLCVVEGDDANKAEAFLLESDDRLDADIVSNFEFCSVTVYSRQRNLRDYDDCDHELKRITEELREITEHVMGYETSEGKHMPSTAQKVLYNKKQIMTGIANLHDVLNER